MKTRVFSLETTYADGGGSVAAQQIQQVSQFPQTLPHRALSNSVIEKHEAAHAVAS
jgi:hypothetical protein